MIEKYIAIALICNADACNWVTGAKQHDEMWQCLYEIAEMRPKYYEAKTMRLVDCKKTSYKQEQ